MFTEIKKTLLLKLARALQTWAQVLFQNIESKAPKAVPNESLWPANPSAGNQSFQQPDEQPEQTTSQPTGRSHRIADTHSAHESMSSPQRPRPDDALSATKSTPAKPSESKSHSFGSPSHRTDSGGVAKETGLQPEKHVDQIEHAKQTSLDVPHPKETPFSQRTSTTWTTHAAAPGDFQSHNPQKTREPQDPASNLHNKTDRHDYGSPNPVARDKQKPSAQSDSPTRVGGPPCRRPSADSLVAPIVEALQRNAPPEDSSPAISPSTPASLSMLPRSIRAPSNQSSTYKTLSTDRKSTVTAQSQTRFNSAERPVAPAMRWPDLPADTTLPELRLLSADMFQAAAAYSRELERQRRLDLEQRGVLWNA